MARKIVVAVDGSDTGNRALDCAAEFSDRLGRGLSIVHVHLHGRPPEELMRLAEAEHLVAHVAAQEDFQNLRLPFGPEEDARRGAVIVAIGNEILARAARRAEAAGARDVTAHLRAGDYADEILEVAKAEDAGMIVLGNRGLGRVREALLGSVSQKVLHHAACTIVIAR